MEKDWGKWVRESRRRLGLTLYDLSSATNIHKMTLYGYERVSSKPSSHEADQFSAALENMLEAQSVDQS